GARQHDRDRAVALIGRERSEERIDPAVRVVACERMVQTEGAAIDREEVTSWSRSGRTRLSPESSDVATTKQSSQSAVMAPSTVCSAGTLLADAARPT